MPRRSSVYDLPPELREELNERLVSAGFGGYVKLSKWLAERGYQISKSAVGRYGQDLQSEFEAAMGDVRKTTELARAYVEGNEDTQGALVDATARMVQEQLLRITIALRKAEHEPEKAAAHIARVTHALADIGRMSLGQKKWAQEVRREAAREAADRASAVAKRRGLSGEAVQEIRREILGVAT